MTSTADTPTWQEVADLLRDAEFALSRAETAMVAFTRPFDPVIRDCERAHEIRKAIKAMLVHLPPAVPLTPEQQAECEALIRSALSKRFGP